MYNLGKLTSFANNIGKLTVGRSTKLKMFDKDGTEKVMAKVFCDTVGVYPRQFTVSCSTGFMPSGGQYTYRKVIDNLMSTVTWM